MLYPNCALPQYPYPFIPLSYAHPIFPQKIQRFDYTPMQAVLKRDARSFNLTGMYGLEGVCYSVIGDV